MKKILQILLTLTVVLSPPLSAFISPNTVVAAKKASPCKDGYFRSPLTNRCKKLVTVSETSSTITTTTYNPNTGLATTTKTCKNGYWWNKKTSRCNKKKVCSIGYKYQSSDNTCKKITCPIGYKVQDSSNTCKRLVCEKGHIINQQTGNCVKNNNGKYKTCDAGWTLDLRTLKCALVGTTGSNDPRSKAAAKKSQSVAKYGELKSEIVLGNIVKMDNTDASEKTNSESAETNPSADTKTCPEGKFLNPKTNRCKNIQEVNETSTGKTITTYDPKTGEATTTKVCNEGYYLNTETNHCNKIKDNAKTSSTKTCPEGQMLNPETNRCKKIKENNGAEHEIEVPNLGSGENTFVAVGSIIAILAIGVGFVAFQFRHEIAKFFKSLFPGKKA